MKRVFLVLLILLPFVFVSCGNQSTLDNNTPEYSTMKRTIDWDCWPQDCTNPFLEGVDPQCFVEYLICVPDGEEFYTVVTRKYNGDIYADTEESHQVFYRPGPPGNGGTQSDHTTATKTTSTDAGGTTTSNLTIPSTPISGGYSISLGSSTSLDLNATAWVSQNGWDASVDGWSASAGVTVDIGPINLGLEIGYCDPWTQPCPW